jgi:hypothetical protein
MNREKKKKNRKRREIKIQANRARLGRKEKRGREEDYEKRGEGKTPNRAQKERRR